MGAMGEFDKRGALLLIFIGGMWPRARRCSAGLVTSGLCSRCGLEEDDEYHCIWDCHKNEGPAFE
eukprot:8954189-Heterocapsa_arctica.AAC.1